MSDDKKTSFKINAEHPCLAGHFPGKPIVPGVVILDEITQLILEQFCGHKVIGFNSVKFLQPLMEEQEVKVQVGELLEASNELSKIKFTASSNNTVIAQGDAKLETLCQLNSDDV